MLVWQAPTRVMNPNINERTIAEAYEDDPAAARSEYGAEFRADLESFIDVRCAHVRSWHFAASSESSVGRKQPHSAARLSRIALSAFAIHVR